MSAFVLMAWLAAAGDLPPEVRTPPAAPAAPAAPAEEESVLRVYGCNEARTACVVSAPDLAMLVQANNYKADEIAKLRDQLKALRESKGCAKLEVLPKLKRERDS